jgi:ketosteroid isomerase-like protein
MIRSTLALGLIVAFGTVVVPGGSATSSTGQGGAAQAPAQLPSVDLPPDLNRVIRDYETHWKGRDGAALSELFTDDGFIARGPWIRGRDAIRAAYATSSGGDLRLRAVGYATGDTVGYIVGAFRYGESPNDGGKFILALRRAPGGQWKIAADLDASIRQ